jgi:hypothetical protein
MLKKLIISILIFPIISLVAQETGEKIKREILLTPVFHLTDNKEFSYLKGIIYNVLLINIKNQETLSVLNDNPEVEKLITQTVGFEAYLNLLKKNFPGATAVITEYYVANDNLHLLINVWDLSTLRVKSSFIETMPADLDMLKNIEKMAVSTAIAVALELPPTERDALFEKQIVVSLRKKINDEEKMVEDIFSGRHEISLVPFSGIGLGRTVVSWSPLGPFISPVLSLEYSCFFLKQFHMRFGFEYLCFDVLTMNPSRNEVTFEALIGLHTASIFSLSMEAGLALIYDINPASAALAYTFESTRITPEVQRFSLSIPLRLGLTLYLSRSFFINLTLKYHGITWTIEPLEQKDYDVGNKRLNYYYGLSPWNLLCVSFIVETGVRF